MLTRKIVFGVVFALVLSCTAQTAAAENLRSPWDVRAVANSAVPYSCPADLHLPRDIQALSFYSDSKFSVVDRARYAAYRKAEEPFENVTRAAEAAADTFQKNGSAAAAQCVLHLLSDAARDQAMTGHMASNQSYYVQNWMTGALAITYLKVRPGLSGAAGQDQEILDWLARLAHSTKDYFDARRVKKTKDSQNNHLYWAGLAVMAVGVATNDRSLFDWAVGTYQDGVSRVTADGDLPLEMGRGARALHYHLFAAAPLVTMAEFGEVNGRHLYAANQGALQRLVERSLSGLLNNSHFTQMAGVKQDTPGTKVTAGDIAWARPYLCRFPEPKYVNLLQTLPSLSMDRLGGDPPE
jgi:poly(beta-D-mannuronate) lyase